MDEDGNFEEPILKLKRRIEELSALPDDATHRRELERLREKLEKVSREIYASLTPWQKTLVARHPARPYTLDYIGALTTEFVELHGDRKFSDGAAIVSGFGFFRGQAVAIVGKNGSGKSTLVKLLCRFYDPDRGSIRWDGVDLRDLDVDALRDRISAVFQDYMTYELSAAENIAVGDLGLADQPAALVAAAEQAGIDATLAALPWGYQTLLTRTYFDLSDMQDPRTGVLLSGGQWQRVALARAFLRGGRDLMILDEPSSGLDPEAERMIHMTLAATRTGRASVLISHRLNAVRDAGHILVLSDGVVREQGDHDTLMARQGPYARLFTMQAQGYSAVPATMAAADG